MSEDGNSESLNRRKKERKKKKNHGSKFSIEQRPKEMGSLDLSPREENHFVSLHH